MVSNRSLFVVCSLLLVFSFPLIAMDIEFKTFGNDSLEREVSPKIDYAEIQELFIAFNCIEREIQTIKREICKIQAKHNGVLSNHNQKKLENFNKSIQSLAGRDYRNLDALLQAKLRNAHVYLLCANTVTVVFIADDLSDALAQFDIIVDPSKRIIWRNFSLENLKGLVSVLQPGPADYLCQGSPVNFDVDQEVADILAEVEDDEFVAVDQQPAAQVAVKPVQTWVEYLTWGWAK